MTQLIYIFDAYCGWCYGFAPTIEEVVASTGLELEVRHGSLFTGDRAGAIGNYPHIPEANKRISELTGVVFGEPYQQLLSQGSMIMDSNGAARGFAALKILAGKGRDLDIAHAMQEAFYLHGYSLSEPATYEMLARHLHLDSSATIAPLYSDAVFNQARATQDWVASAGIQGYPTLLLEHEENCYMLGGVNESAQQLSERINTIVG